MKGITCLALGLGWRGLFLGYAVVEVVLLQSGVAFFAALLPVL